MPVFKSNVDFQRNQLLSAVLENLSASPSTPVEGQMYYNDLKKTAYIWNGTSWEVWGPSKTQEIRQFCCHIKSPVASTGLSIARLYEDMEVLRIDSHINTGTSASFHIEHRSSVNSTGSNLTSSAIQAVTSGTETTVFTDPLLSANRWLYLNIVSVSGTVGILTITITCAVSTGEGGIQLP